MPDMIFQVNPKATLQLSHVGNENTPLIIIDDFALDTRQVIEYACSSVEYGPDSTSAYPGIRGKLPREYVVAVLNSIFPLLFKVFAVPVDLGLKPVNTVYSLISIPQEELQLAQRVPHFDSNSPHYLAVLHYLNPGKFCATGLFRHRPTGFEKILEPRRSEFFESSRAFMEEHGPPPQKYIDGSNDHYELYKRIEYKPNRLVVYPGSLLHSGLVDPAIDINPDPGTGRLTANIFVDFKQVNQGT